MMSSIKKIYGWILMNCRYIISRKYIKKIHSLGYCIKSIQDTIDFIKIPDNCMVRFGDGEVDLINGVGISNYQTPNEELSSRLLKIAMYNDEKMLVCFPDSLVTLQDKKKKTKMHWAYSFKRHYDVYKKLCRENYIYGNSFVSRPYFIYNNHENAATYFQELIKIFENRDLLVVEGEYSRTGVGNELFSKAKSVKRVVCPAKNAFDNYEKILQAVLSNSKGKLVLVALGPTAKPLCIDLFEAGHWVLDIGHVDSEYEWFLKRSKKKELLYYKHTAECSDEDVRPCTDENYLKSIVERIEC